MEQLWNVSNGTVLLAWQAAAAAVIAAGFLSPGRILVVSADAVVGSVFVLFLSSCAPYCVMFRVFEIADDAVQREPIMQQPIHRFPKLTCAVMHPPSGIITAANDGSVVAFTIALPAKAQSPVMFLKRASSCVAMCFTSTSGRLAVAFQDGFIFIYKV